VQWKPVDVGRNLVAGPVVTEVVLGLPGGIHDEVVGQGEDLKAKESRRKPGLNHLVALGCLAGVVDRVGQVPSRRPNELFNTMPVAFQHGVLEIQGEMTSRGCGPIFTLRAPLTAGQWNPIFWDGDGADGASLGWAGGAADADIGLGPEIGGRVPSRSAWSLLGLLASHLVFLHTSDFLNLPLKVRAEG
jgi:hypothetical protein